MIHDTQYSSLDPNKTKYQHLCHMSIWVLWLSCEKCEQWDNSLTREVGTHSHFTTPPHMFCPGWVCPFISRWNEKIEALVSGQPPIKAGVHIYSAIRNRSIRDRSYHKLVWLHDDLNRTFVQIQWWNMSGPVKVSAGSSSILNAGFISDFLNPSFPGNDISGASVWQHRLVWRGWDTLLCTAQAGPGLDSGAGREARRGWRENSRLRHTAVTTSQQPGRGKKWKILGVSWSSNN